MSEFDPLTGGTVGNNTSSPAEQVRQHFVPESTQAERQLTEREWSTNRSVVDHDKGLWHQLPETPLPPTPEDESDSPTLKRVPALPRQTSFLPTPEDVSDSPTLKSVPAFPKQTSFLPIPEDVSGADSVDSMDLRNNRQVGSLHRFQGKNTWRTAVFTLLLLLIASGTVGIVLISRQNAALAGLKGTFFDSSKILLGLCIVLAIAFTVSFNIISRVSLSTTRHEYAYTILWQLFCALLAPLFLLFDRFSISVSPHVLLLFALSVVLWALVDAFLFSAFKYEEASVLSAIFPLNFVFTFVVSVVFFHSTIKLTIIVGFLIIMLASLLIGLYHTRFRLSKGIVFGLLYSFFLGVALGFNSEVVKSFSIPPYMVAAFLFPAVANMLIFLRPKGAELRYELKVQWKNILLNAAVMDASFFFLLKAFQLGNVPQVVALSASSTLLTALVGVVVLKEDKHRALKIIAAGLATLGLVLVQL
ncbi:MAG: EamA family transporter [Ktedonobacteraceae bacterium]